MLRQSLLALALTLGTSSAFADANIWGRVTLVEPNFVLSIGSGHHHDGYRVRYEFDGHHYWTHSRHHPGHFIWVPRPRSPYVRHYGYRHDWDRHRDWNDNRHDDGHRRHDNHRGHGIRHPNHYR